MRIEHAPGLVVDWSEKEWEKIQEVKARPRRYGQLSRMSKHDREIRDLWRYWNLFFHPELRMPESMKWEAAG